MALGGTAKPFVTNFKHQQPTAMEYRAKRKADKRGEQRACYAKVDARDGGCDRVTGQYLWPGHSDPKLRREHHHLTARSKGGAHETQNVVTISAYLHALIHAGKVRLSGDADARDPDGTLCGVQYEINTECGWETERFY